MDTNSESETRTRTRKRKVNWWLLCFVAMLFFGSMTLSYVLKTRDKTQQAQQDASRISEERRRTELSVGYAIEVAENLNKHEAFGPGVIINPQDIVHLSVGELTTLNEGVGRGSAMQYARALLKGPLPLHDAEISGNWSPPFFVINGRLLWIKREPNCAKSGRSVYFPSVWTIPNPDRLLVKVGGRSTFVSSENSLAALLGIGAERIQALGIWPKTCTWSVQLPATTP